MDAPPALLRAARAALNLSQQELAKLSGVSPRTIYRIEKGDALIESMRVVQQALERSGVIFLPEDDNTKFPGIRVKLDR